GGFCRGDVLRRAVGAAGAEESDCAGGGAGSAGDAVVGLESYGGDAGGGWVSDAVHGAGGLGDHSGAPERVVAGAGTGSAAGIRVSAGDPGVFEECALSGGGGPEHVWGTACACDGLDGSVLCGVYRDRGLAGTGGARCGSVWGREHVAAVDEATSPSKEMVTRCRQGPQHRNLRRRNRTSLNRTGPRIRPSSTGSGRSWWGGGCRSWKSMPARSIWTGSAGSGCSRISCRTWVR